MRSSAASSASFPACYRFEAPLVFANAEIFGDGVLAAVAAAEPRAVVLDLGPVPDVDSTGELALAELAWTLDGRGIQVLVARATAEVGALLARGTSVATIGADNFYPTVRDAVAAVDRRTAPEPVAQSFAM